MFCSVFLLFGGNLLLSLVFTRRKHKHKDLDKRLNKKIQRSVQRKHQHKHSISTSISVRLSQNKRHFKRKPFRFVFKSHNMTFFFCIPACAYAYACVYTQQKTHNLFRAVKTALFNVLLPTLFLVVNNIVQHCYT